MNLLFQFFLNLRFKQKLVLSYLVVIIIPVTVLGLYSYNQSDRFLQDQAVRELTTTAKTIADQVNYKIERYHNVSNTITFHVPIERILRFDYFDLFEYAKDLRYYLEPYFNMIQRSNKEVSAISIYTNRLPEYDQYLLSLDRVRTGRWYNELNADKQEVMWRYEDGVLYTVRKIPPILIGTTEAYLYLKFDYDVVFADIAEYANLSHLGILITDREGRNDVFWRDTKIGVPDMDRFKKEIISNRSRVTEVQGIRYLLIKDEIPLAGWNIYFYIPLSEISADSGKIINATLLIGVVCLGILILIAGFFSNTLVRQILSLNNKMKLVQAGHLNVVVSSRSRDEIGELTRQFGSMLKTINQLITEDYQNKIIQKEAQLKALQSQINPHFLYNTLSIINWKALRIDANDISHVATTLARFYRTALNKGESLIAVRDEIVNTQSYVELQLIMHDNNFEVIYQFDEQIFEYTTINLTLQPLVENAIVHGIDQLPESGGKLIISGRIKEDIIELTVEDNGPGVAKAMLEEIFIYQSRGYGLKNVNERIKLAFGEQYGLFVESEPGEGTRMKLLLPKKSRT